MNDNLPPGVTDRDIDRHFGPSEVQEEWEKLNRKSQLDVCLEYIDNRDAYTSFDEWVFERIKKEHPEWIIEWCENSPDFWEYIA